MATAPVKSQPLHNFSLPCWKWGTNNNDSHRRRRPPDSSGASPSPPPDSHRSSPSRHGSDGGGARNGSDSEKRASFSIASCSALRHRAPAGGGVDGALEADESGAKPWNLRPRRAVTKGAVEIGELQETTACPAAAPPAESLPKSMRLRGFNDGNGSEKKNKFWISLSRDEIEEDVYSMTGSKPARRPKKRAKNVQKQVDHVFPGLYLAGVSAESYKSS